MVAGAPSEQEKLSFPTSSSAMRSRTADGVAMVIKRSSVGDNFTCD